MSTPSTSAASDSTSFSSAAPRLPIVLAPMAGGPSTPELTAAVSNAGGLGMLAAGYLTPEALTDAAHRTASLLADGHTFGINLFCPASVGDSATEDELQQWALFRDRLAPVAERFGVELPAAPAWSDDHYTAKVDAILDKDFLPDAAALEYVSFTFGYPDADIITRIKDSGRKVILNATSIDASAQQVRPGQIASSCRGSPPAVTVGL
nr:nitronate monooxygenase [Corynebacterium lactis]